MNAKVGLLVGMEDTFPGPFLDLVNERGSSAGRQRGDGARLGGIPEVEEPPRYQVVVDRISHEVPFYRAYLKSAALQGTVVVNDPFWWEADEKFFECTLARKLGVAVPRTVVLPNHSYVPFIDPQRSLRNLEYPLDWERIIAYVGLPAVLKPNTGGGGRDVFTMVDSLQELIEAYDRTETKTMILQERIEWNDYVRLLGDRRGRPGLPLRPPRARWAKVTRLPEPASRGPAPAGWGAGAHPHQRPGLRHGHCRVRGQRRDPVRHRLPESRP